jgi:glycosyltransferase involved in cell wall biosynthesis
MKILIATYFGLPDVGGLNSYVNILKSQLEEHGHKVDIFAHHTSWTKLHLVNTNQIIEKSTLGKVIHSPLNLYYDKQFKHVDSWIRIIEIQRYIYELAVASIDLSQYDLIHTQDIVSTRALARVKPKNVPLIATIHGFYTYELLNHGHIKSKDTLEWEYMVTAERLAVESASKTIVLTKWMQQQFVEIGIPAYKLQVLPTGINIEQFIQQLDNEPLPPIQKDPQKLVIACPARLVPEKDHKTLIDALLYLKEKRQDFVCWIIGDGGLRNELEKYCEEVNLKDFILFLGNRSDVPSLLKISDIVVLPSMQENLPITIMEAQTAGKAIVASNAGGIPETVEHLKTGLLFEKRNSLQLSQMLLQLMESPALRKILGKNARLWGEKQWSSKTFYKRIMTTYHAALDSVYTFEQENKNDTDQNLTVKSFNDLFNFDSPRKILIPPEKEWSSILNYIPSNYSLPDTAFTPTLSITKLHQAT